MRWFVFQLMLVLLIFQVSAANAGDESLVVTVNEAFSKHQISSKDMPTMDEYLWNPDRNAIAVSSVSINKTTVYIFIIQPDESYLPVNLSDVEDANLRKLGLCDRSCYSKVKTEAIRWLPSSTSVLKILIQTQAWKNGQRHTMSEPVTITASGLVLWR